MSYNYVKALHIIFVVTWFAGLFYIVRLFVYYAEAFNSTESEKSILLKQYQLMQRRLWYGITWPSAVLTLFLGVWMYSFYYPSLPDWLFSKIILVIVLYLYHFSCQYIFNKQQNNICPYSSIAMRVWNEVATVLLVGIVFLVTLKNTLSMLYGLIGLVIFTAVLMIAIFIYKKIRNG
jgi:putative membrane protein